MGGVTGGCDSTFSVLSGGVAADFGLEGSAGWLAEDVRECAGGVGGGSGPLARRLARWRPDRFGLGSGLGGGPACDTDASFARLYLNRLDRGASSFRGCGSTLCFLNMRGWPPRVSASKPRQELAWAVPRAGSETRKSLPTVIGTDSGGALLDW